MERKLMIECLKNSIKELSTEKYEREKIGLEKASLDFVDILEQQNNEVIELLDGLVCDVGNLLCDVADLDFEWQQAGYYETAKVFLKRLKENNESMNFHECSECNCRCNCTDAECSCSCRTET